MAAISVTLRWLVPMMVLSLAISPCRAQIVIDSLDGPVTGHEVDSAITYASSLAIPYLQYDATSTHNDLAAGKRGTVLEGLNDLYGVTRHHPTLRVAGFDDRCCSTQTYDYLPTGFICLTPFNTDIFEPAATADINSGHVKGGVGIAAGILWAKEGLDLQARRLRHQQQLRRVWPRRTATRGGGVLV